MLGKLPKSIKTALHVTSIIHNTITISYMFPNGVYFCNELSELALFHWIFSILQPQGTQRPHFPLTSMHPFYKRLFEQCGTLFIASYVVQHQFNLSQCDIHSDNCHIQVVTCRCLHANCYHLSATSVGSSGEQRHLNFDQMMVLEQSFGFCRIFLKTIVTSYSL